MEPFIGQIQAFGFNFAPRGWAKCEGQLLPISSNTALFSLLGTTYGGDGRTTFGLPDLRGRSMVGTGNGPGLDSINWGERGGQVNKTLTVNEMPSHNHVTSVNVYNSTGDESAPTGHLSSHSGAFSEDSTSGAHLSGVTNSNAGNNTSFNIRNPFLGITICIALVGIFPSRS